MKLQLSCCRISVTLSWTLAGLLNFPCAGLDQSQCCVQALPPQFLSPAAPGARPLTSLQPHHLQDAPGVGIPQVHASPDSPLARLPHRASGQPLQHLSVPHGRLLHLQGEVAGGEAVVDDGDGERQDQDPRQDAEEGQHLSDNRVGSDVPVADCGHGGGCPPPSCWHTGEGGGRNVVLKSEDQCGKDGDANTEEEEQEADFLIALSDGHTQRLQAWTQSRTEEQK